MTSLFEGTIGDTLTASWQVSPRLAAAIRRELAERNGLPVDALESCPRCDIECIISVAIKLPSGLVLSLPAPARHHNVLHLMAELDIHRRDEERQKQGFLTNRGRFVDREEAHAIALAAKQIIKKTPGKGLFSEDVW